MSFGLCLAIGLARGEAGKSFGSEVITRGASWVAGVEESLCVLLLGAHLTVLLQFCLEMMQMCCLACFEC